MANERELSLKITGDSSKAEKAVANLEAALKKAERELEKAKETTEKVDDSVEGLGGQSDKAGGLLSKFGDTAGRTAQEKLGPMGDALGKVGVDLEKVGPSGMVAAAGVAGFTKFVADGVGKVNELVDEVRSFKDASGASWDTSSRMVAVLDDFGVSAETGAGAMNKLAKSIDAGALEQFGLQAVKAKDGSVDMAATLGVVIDALNSTGDQSKKAAMGTALLGKSWLEMAPIINMGSDALNENLAAVKDQQIVNQDLADQQRELSLAMDDLHDSVTNLQMGLAKDFIPQLAEAASNLAVVVDMADRMTQKIGGLHTVVSAISGPMMYLTDVVKKEIELWHLWRGETTGATGEIAGLDMKVRGVASAEDLAADKARLLTAHTKDLTDAAKDAAQAVKDQEAAVKSLRDTVEGVVDAQLGYDRSVTALNDSTDALTQKQLVLADAVNTYGGDSKEAWAATRDYQLGIQAAESAAVANAKATVAMAEQQAAATGVTITAEQKNIIYRDSLNKVRDSTTDPALKDGLGGLIGLVDDTAAAAGRAEQKLLAANAAAALLAAAAKGITTITTGPAAGMVGGGSADSQERALTNQRATTTVINNNVTAYGADARDLGQLVNEQLINQRMERGG